MAERNIGLIKQVIRCLQLDRQLPKGSWPKLLTEVSFHINGMVNATSRVSPHMLTFGREPHSPLESWCENLGGAQRNSHGEYLNALRNKQIELQDIARNNIERNLANVRNRRNEGKVEMLLKRGDKAMLKRNTIADSLTEKYSGPFEVLEKRGPDVKLRLSHGDKWVHMDNVEKYMGCANDVDLAPNSIVASSQSTEEAIMINGEQEDRFQSQTGSKDPQETEDLNDDLDQVDDYLDKSLDSVTVDFPRYPSRNKKRPKYLEDYIACAELQGK